MRVFSRVVLLSLAAAALAAGAFAAAPTDPGARRFIAIADLATGRALVPEGSVIPAGVRFFVQDQTAGAASKERVQLVFAYAPDSEFAAARKTIDAARALAAPPVVRYVVAPESAGGRQLTADDRGIITEDAPQWFYLYFSDGSYTSALRHVFTSDGSTWYGSGTEAYSAPGSYWTGTVDASLSSNLVWGPTGGPYFDPYGYTNSCTVGPSGGGCGTSYPYVVTSQPFSATVDSTGSIFQRFPGCWTNPNSQCLRYFSGTIQVTFP